MPDLRDFACLVSDGLGKVLDGLGKVLDGGGKVSDGLKNVAGGLGKMFKSYNHVKWGIANVWILPHGGWAFCQYNQQ